MPQMSIFPCNIEKILNIDVFNLYRIIQTLKGIRIFIFFQKDDCNQQ